MRKGIPSFNYGKKKDKAESPAEVEINGPVTKTGMIVNSSFVSVYEAPSDVAKTVDYISSGEEVEILGKKENGFYKVKYGRFSRIGYVSSNFCKGV